MPSTCLHEFGATKKLQSEHCFPSFGSVWYLTDACWIFASATSVINARAGVAAATAKSARRRVYAAFLQSILHGFLVLKTRRHAAVACQPSQGLFPPKWPQDFAKRRQFEALPTLHRQFRTFSKLNLSLTVVNTNLRYADKERRIDGWRCGPVSGDYGPRRDFSAHGTLHSGSIQWHEPKPRPLISERSRSAEATTR